MFTLPLSGKVGGRFVIAQEVGRGAVGVVYRAADTVSGQDVALKVIAISGVDSNEEARFQREGRVLAGLVHPSIVRLVAFGHLEAGQPYVAMEWLEGEDVSARQTREPLGLSRALQVTAQIADALGAAHDAGIIHRDVKPSNIILLSDEDATGEGPKAKLVDFGVASGGDARLTQTGAIIGTPAYMAPEQARGDFDVGPAADIYSLGATLFEVVAGRPPHVGPTPVAILARLVTAPAARLSEIVDGIPEPLDDLVASMLAMDPESRPPTAQHVARALRTIAKELPEDAEHMTSGQWAVASSPASSAPAASMGVSRLVTTILATQVPKGPTRSRMIAQLRAQGAEATELGGDAIVAHLGVHKAQGDEARRAIELARRLSSIDASVGVASGRIKIERVRPSGEVVDRAAALSRDAGRGNVFTDPTTAELARGDFEFRPLPGGNYQVGEAVAGDARSLGAAPFVGRDAELAQIVASFERSMDDDLPAIAAITGPPGIGKTRLGREAIEKVRGVARDARVLILQCEPFARSQTLGTVAELLRQLANVRKGVGRDEALIAAERLASDSGVPDGETHELLATLMANRPLPEYGDARAARDALWLALTRITTTTSARAPLVVAIEDAQWADAESLVWLDHVLARAAGHKLWILLTARPAFWRDDPRRFSARELSRVELRPLSKRSVAQIAEAVLGPRAKSTEGQGLTETIVGQAAGSPLFAEELARLAARGRDATSAPTIEAAMQVQLDALDDTARAAAARLSVYGLVGWDDGLEAQGTANAEEALRTLAAADIVREQPTSRFTGSREWAFKHALMREVAYASLGDVQLQDAHKRAGLYLASKGEDDATVARHFELGGENGIAAHHWAIAARRALAAHALSEAVSMAERALAFADDNPTTFARAQLLDEAWSRQDARSPERETAILAMQESIYDEASTVRAKGAKLRYEDARGGDDETSQRLREICAAARDIGLADEEARCSAALAARLAFAGELQEATQVTARLLELAQLHGIAGAEVDAWQTRAVLGQARGDVGAALDARKSAADAASRAGLKTREATLTINMGFALTTMGAKRASRRAIESGIRLAQDIGSPGTVWHGKMNLLCWAATFGGTSELDRLLEEPRSMADAVSAGSWVPHDRATLGVLFYRGQELLRGGIEDAETKARALLKIAAQGYEATKMLDVVPVALGLLAEAERQCGDLDTALDTSSRAAQLLDEGSPSLLNEASVFCALSACLRDKGDEAGAKDAVRRAMPYLEKRVAGLASTPYVKEFLREIEANARMVEEARKLGLLPSTLDDVLANAVSSPSLDETT